MRTRTQRLAGYGFVALAWATVTISTLNQWNERLHESVIGTAICITVCVTVGTIAVGNRRYYRCDLEILRNEVDSAIKASSFGRLLADAEMPFRPAVPDGPVRSVPITGENAIIGVREGSVIDIDAARDAIRRSES